MQVRQVGTLDDFIDPSVEIIIKVSRLIKCSFGTGHIVLTYDRWVTLVPRFKFNTGHLFHRSIDCPVHTADAVATQLSRWVTSVLWTHPSAVVTQFTISCAVELLRLATSDDIMTSSLKKLSISIKIHTVKPLWSVFGQFPNCRPNPSAVVVTCESTSYKFCSHRRHDSSYYLWVEQGRNFQKIIRFITWLS